MGLFKTAEAKAIIEARTARVAALQGLTSPDLLERCEAIWEATRQAINDETITRRRNPIILLNDAEMHLQHVVTSPLDYEFEWIENDTGTGELVLLAEDPAGQWLHDFEGRDLRGEGVAPVITCEYVGGRWGGRLDDVSIEVTTEGDRIITATFMHAYENLKWIECFPSPFLPAITQLKAWILLGPADWCGLTTLFVNLMRDESPLTMPDDPMDLEQWTEGLDVSTWQMVVNPVSFMDAMESGALWCLPIIRMKYWHDAFKPIMDDAELSVVAEYWFEGDDEPWPDANLRHGTLVFSITDNSGRYTSGTSQGGTLFGGLSHTVEKFIDDTFEPLVELATNAPPDDYMTIGVKSTDKVMPYVILRPGVTPGVESARFTTVPERVSKIITGGKSMPGVNEAISALIQALGDVVGDNIGAAIGIGISYPVSVGSVGGAIDVLLRPIYEDTLMAWTDTKVPARAQKLGWSRYVEFFQDGADQAYTLASLMMIRKGLWATRRWNSHEVKIIDSCPWMVGDNGVGHMWLGSRVGTTKPGDNSGRVYVDRIKKIVLSASEDAFHPEWTITVGDDNKTVDPFETALDQIRNLASGLHDIGLV